MTKKVANTNLVCKSIISLLSINNVLRIIIDDLEKENVLNEEEDMKIMYWVKRALRISKEEMYH